MFTSQAHLRGNINRALTCPAFSTRTGKTSYYLPCFVLKTIVNCTTMARIRAPSSTRLPKLPLDNCLATKKGGREKEILRSSSVFGVNPWLLWHGHVSQDLNTITSDKHTWNLCQIIAICDSLGAPWVVNDTEVRNVPRSAYEDFEMSAMKLRSIMGAHGTVKGSRIEYWVSHNTLYQNDLTALANSHQIHPTLLSIDVPQ